MVPIYHVLTVYLCMKPYLKHHKPPSDADVTCAATLYIFPNVDIIGRSGQISDRRVVKRKSNKNAPKTRL